MEKDEVEQLVMRAQTGDQEAFSLLYDEFAGRIYKFIKFKIFDDEQAEDLLQEVFVKAWTGCPKLRLADLNFSAWLYTVASNTVNDHFRKVYRRPQTVSLDPAIDIPGDSDTSRNTTAAFDGALVYQALEKLPPHYKQVLELRYIQEFSIEDTARAMRKSSIAVRVLQHRAMKRLQNTFKHKP